LKKYIELPKFGILPSMLNTLGGMLPVFIISSYYSVDATGNYNFSRIILSVPFALISTAISQVLMQQVSERKLKNQGVYDDMVSVAIKLMALSVVGILVLFFAGPQLFEIVFGSKWRQAGEYTSILIFSYSVSFAVSPFSMLLVVLGKIKMVSVWQTFYFFAVSLLWLARDLSITNFLIALVIIDILSYSIYGIIIYKAIWSYERNLSQ
jgi:O-antigen/teichoic acid export membrane protein